MNGKKNPSSGNSLVDGLFELDWLLLFQRVFGFAWSTLVELYRGVARGTMPFIPCLLVGAAASWAVSNHWDYLLLQKFEIEWLYPVALRNSSNYRIAMLFSGCVGWAFLRAIRNIGDQNRAKQVFESAGLKSRTGQVPRLLAREHVGDGTERLRIFRAGLHKEREGLSRLSER